jgi:hypothetical protein
MKLSDFLAYIKSIINRPKNNKPPKYKYYRCPLCKTLIKKEIGLKIIIYNGPLNDFICKEFVCPECNKPLDIKNYIRGYYDQY